MEKHILDKRRTVSVRITPYLAEYVRGKYPHDPANGGVRFPRTDDLYHCLWHNLVRPRKDMRVERSPNLTLSIGRPRTYEVGLAWKDPAYFNHLSARGAKELEVCVQRQFDFELHRAFIESYEAGDGRRQEDVAHDFLRQYGITSISEEALLKNWSRYRNMIRPKKPRRYGRG